MLHYRLQKGNTQSKNCGKLMWSVKYDTIYIALFLIAYSLLHIVNLRAENGCMPGNHHTMLCHAVNDSCAYILPHSARLTS